MAPQVRMKGHIKFALVAGFCFVPPLLAMQMNPRAAGRWREFKDGASEWLLAAGRERGSDVFPGSGLGRAGAGAGAAAAGDTGAPQPPKGAAAAAAEAAAPAPEPQPRYASSNAVQLK